MDTPTTATLRKLSDADLTVADRSNDIRGMKVLDRGGEQIGTVDALLIDDRERKVRFMEVASGGFLGMGESHSLIPIDAITRIDDAVHVDQTREHVAGAPRYDPDLVADRDYYGGYYGYYGYMPWWGPGYVYPPYPYYP